MIRFGLLVGILAFLVGSTQGQGSLPTEWTEQNRVQYPSPRDDFQACARSNYSWVCDPNRQFTTQQADELDDIMATIYKSNCPCGIRCPATATQDRGFIVILTIVQSYVYHGGEENFPRYFREHKQTDAHCGEETIIFYDFATKQMEISTGLRAFQTLTDQLTETIRAPYDNKLKSDDREDNFEGLKGFLTVADTVFKGTYEPPGLKVWAHMLIAAGAALAFIFAASILFCGCASCKAFWGDGQQHVLAEEEEDAEKTAGQMVPFYHMMPSGVKGAPGGDGENLIDADGQSSPSSREPEDEFAVMAKVGMGRKGRRV